MTFPSSRFCDRRKAKLMLPKDLVPLARKVGKEEIEARIVKILAMPRTPPVNPGLLFQNGTTTTLNTPWTVTTTNPLYYVNGPGTMVSSGGSGSSTTASSNTSNTNIISGALQGIANLASSVGFR